jgi:hypothetical protein
MTDAIVFNVSIFCLVAIIGMAILCFLPRRHSVKMMRRLEDERRQIE